jgi:hypothetical protein
MIQRARIWQRNRSTSQAIPRSACEASSMLYYQIIALILYREFCCCLKRLPSLLSPPCLLPSLSLSVTTSWCPRLPPLRHQRHSSIPILLRTHPQMDLRTLHSWAFPDEVPPRFFRRLAGGQVLWLTLPVRRCVYIWGFSHRPLPVRACDALLTIKNQ